MENHANTPLPPDIIAKIFMLLPLDSILTCKLVSKEWNNVVKDPTFIKLYLNKSTTFFLTGNTLNCLFRSDDDNNSYKLRRIPIELNKHRKSWHNLMEQHELLLETSNKMACVKADNDNFLLYNLLTGDSRVVEDAPFRDSSYSYWLCYGFGYDCYEDDYKITVVTLWSLNFRRFDLSTDVNNYNKNNSLIFVYSYKNRCWKISEGFPHDAYCWRRYRAQAYSFSRGVFHWVVSERGAQDLRKEEKVIAAVDIHSCGFVEILLPPVYYDDSAWKPVYETLTELGGNLCCSYAMVTFDVWVMKEYGVPESWTKLFSILNWRINSHISTPFFDMKCIALYQCRDARKIVVFLCHNSIMELFRYDIDEDEIDQHDRYRRRQDRLAPVHHIDKDEIEVFCKHVASLG